jgi:6-phosphogluconolactonase
LADANAQIVTTADPIGEAAGMIVRALEQADRFSGSARIAIPGGSAAIAIGRVRRDLDPGAWRRLRLTWVDERCVPFDHDESNRGSAHRSRLLDPATPPGIELALFADGETPDAARARAEAGLARDFGGAIDVALLGMGDDGHVASIFPGHRALSARGLVAVEPRSPKPPAVRMTLTLPTLRTAPTVVLIVTGETKREALGRLATGDPTVPATLLGHAVVFTDLRI